MVNFKEDERLTTLNHSCAHVMAQAVKHLYPHAKFWVGPVVKEGFYYDIDLGNDVVNDEVIAAIEKEMKKICKEGKKIYRREVSKAEAMEMFKDDMYKLDLISNLEDGNITVYDQGDFHRSVPWTSRRQHQAVQELQTGKTLRRILEGRCQQPRNAAYLWCLLPYRRGTGSTSERAGRGQRA